MSGGEKESNRCYRQPNIVVIDEAQQFLNDIDIGIPKFNYFPHFQEFLKNKWDRHRIFGILVETGCRAPKYVPPRLPDPSAKFLAQQYHEFQPFILMATLDIKKIPGRLCADTKVKDSLPCHFEKWNYLRSPIHGNEWQDITYLCQLGRPVWGNSWTKKHALIALYSEDRSRNMTYESSLAIMFCRLGGLFAPTSQVGPTLVAKHMATLLDIDNRSGSMLCGYISDPFLANAAKVLWRRSNEKLLILYFIPAMQRAFLDGVVSEVHRGDCVARIILLVLVDNLQDTNGWVDLAVFLQHFYPKNAKHLYNLKTPKGAKIGFCHFVIMSVNIEQETIAYLGQRLAAAMLTAYHPGDKLLIPYWYTDENKSVVWSYILVRVLNHEICPEKHKIQEELHPDFVFSQNSNFKDNFDHSKVISICMCLGCGNNSTSIGYTEKPNPASSAATPQNTLRQTLMLRIDPSMNNPLQQPAAPILQNNEEKKVPLIWRCGAQYAPNFSYRCALHLEKLLRCTLSVNSWQKDRFNPTRTDG